MRESITTAQIQKSPTSIGGEMNAVLSHFSAGFQTSAEIGELSLRTPRPVAIYCAKAKRQQHGFICAKAKRQQ
ncbi:hypothetical protein ACIQXF_12665 [Lysinibacillus sp. NPDC097231]|uniref:hypothetical protein n=1 Tax=Lysinibacillus sp. NPDC097231 TaxID=3364142 RepID=UPI003820927F